jgi:hypothetical protein
MGVFSSARPKPQQTPTQPTELIGSDAAMETPTVNAPQGEHITSYDLASIQKFMGMEPELPPLPSDGAATESTTATPPPVDGATASDTVNAAKDAADAAEATADTADTRKWYERWFGGKDADGPAQMEENAELDNEMYRVTAEAATEVTDQLLPMFIGRLHDRPAADFKADEEQKMGLARAWELYQRSKKMRLSPLQFLLFKISIVYGVNLVLGIFSWVGRLGIYGWHWPWSDSWKHPKPKKRKPGEISPARAEYLKNMKEPPVWTDEMEEALEKGLNPDDFRPKPQPEPQTAPQPSPAPAPQTTPAPGYKKCAQTGRLFRTGEGYPQAKHKTGQSFSQFVDAFADRAAWMAYSNKHALYGQGGKQGMTTKPETAE